MGALKRIRHDSHHIKLMTTTNITHRPKVPNPINLNDLLNGLVKSELHRIYPSISNVDPRICDTTRHFLERLRQHRLKLLNTNHTIKTCNCCIKITKVAKLISRCVKYSHLIKDKQSERIFQSASNLLNSAYNPIN